MEREIGAKYFGNRKFSAGNGKLMLTISVSEFGNRKFSAGNGNFVLTISVSEIEIVANSRRKIFGFRIVAENFRFPNFGNPKY